MPVLGHRPQAAAIKLDQLKSGARSLELSFFLYHVYHIERYHDETFFGEAVLTMELPRRHATHDETAASLLHCTCTAFLGHTQARVDLQVAPLLL
jgi:hypothetical protein